MIDENFPIEMVIHQCLPTYHIVKKIGEGVYGAVYQLQDEFKSRAVKIVPVAAERSITLSTGNDLNSKISHDFQAVRKYYESIKGEGVIEVLDFHLVGKQISDQTVRAYLVILMAYYPDNLLNYVVNRYPVPLVTIRQLIRDLARVMDRLYHNNPDAFVITDLKPSNLLIDHNNKLYIGDLGGIKRLGSISTTTHLQLTPNWTAPELILRSVRPGISSTIFSFGLILYFAFEGKLPYEDMDFVKRFHAIRDKGIHFNRHDIPGEFKALIRQCLEFEPSRRPTHFQDILQHLTDSRHASNGSTAYEKKVAVSGINQKEMDASILNTQGNRVQMDTHALPHAPSPSDPHHWSEPYTGMDFIWVPDGRFEMGCGKWSEQGFENELPLHEVRISGFWMGKYPVTQGQWKKIMGTNHSCFKLGNDYPVEQVSWLEAMAFLKRLSQKNNHPDLFSLPSEAQWEYAAGSCGKQEPYAGGIRVDELAWYIDNSDGSTQPVGKKRPNHLGLFDICGNVWEWCRDYYQENAYSMHASLDPEIIVGEGYRVHRGGSWLSTFNRCRVSGRGKYLESGRSNHIGFRVIRIK
ncbi:MAG: hypothetical protein COS92_08630 [Desulfobacterales bacterium CG07_land_8_20_14_0_80_52_14]|nr:MAG: hypothetical protein COX20_05440 [Desulfobacterales bacterium CG23_combo_of_CG06-09_8_20_14_all_52_9]PIU49056.1 MAG: hypothetical protein COS92_08630 [Desulfobacterales bacterium CG07_land_8_20_14_0_80_52_14]